MAAYYNEIDPYAAQWLRNLIAAGHIAPGDVDERSIIDVQPDDLKGYTQCHFFAGIGGWSYAARLAGWPDERELWTGSCPCQPFSVAGKGEGQKDERHLWPEYFRLIRARAPTVVMGEQVAAAVGKDWLDGVFVDLESIGYACGAAVVPACAVDAPHRRDRLWFVADAPHSNDRICYAGQGERCQPKFGGRREPDAMADAENGGRGEEYEDGRGFDDAGDRQEGRAARPDAGYSSMGNSDQPGRQELRYGGVGGRTEGKVQAWTLPSRTGRGSHWHAGTPETGRPH
ncbi:DNA cytosine methyltransferase [Rhizobium laguerreae]|nr:DNA cytosine methyltransferase [Rhizobium laguerreae]